jgi:hypothetical protein
MKNLPNKIEDVAMVQCGLKKPALHAIIHGWIIHDWTHAQDGGYCVVPIEAPESYYIGVPNTTNHGVCDIYPEQDGRRVSCIWAATWERVKMVVGAVGRVEYLILPESHQYQAWRVEGEDREQFVMSVQERMRRGIGVGGS